jgi:hypothetical protein
MIDQYCGQRYTVFNAFVNLFDATGNDFYRLCATTFVYTRNESS